MKSSTTFLAGPALALALVLTGCSPRGPQRPPEEATPVEVSYPIERAITDNSDLTGRIEAVDSVAVRPRVWGYVDKVNFKEGMLVKKGDVLVEIDARTYKAALGQAEGKLASLGARLERLEADYVRVKRLIKTATIAQEEYDKVVGDRAETIADVEAQRAVVDQARLDLEFTKVTAAISGRVGRALVTEGNLVQAGPTGGTVLTTLVSVDPIYAYFDVDERTVLRVRQLIREGKVQSARDVTWPVSVGLANEEGYPHQGVINFVDNQVNPRVGTLRVRAVLDNKDEALSPGYFVRVRVPIGHPHKAFLISDRAIDTDQGQKIVYVVNAENKVAIRAIRLGGTHEGWRAVEEGLTAADRVIVTGIQQIRPGALVDPKVVDMPHSPIATK